MPHLAPLHCPHSCRIFAWRNAKITFKLPAKLRC
ncbi:hypothetical protein LTSEJOH_4542, partial [Salmonella enterica subsp. enterica serovar Johannesburg str. S5-703]